jgi:hypothetical protein
LELSLLSEQAGIELPDPVDDETARALLRTGELTIIGRMPWSSNATFLVEAVGSDALQGHRLLAIYKPRAGERPLWDFPDGTLCEREVAACVVSDLLGWDLVPDTVLRDGPAGIGSVARFVDHDPEAHYFEVANDHPEVFRRFAAFDIVCNNTDRKGGHVLRDEHGHIWGIDHGVCFHVQSKLRTVIWEFAGEPVPADLLDDLDHLRRRVDIGDAHGLDELLAPDELDALQTRVERLVRTARYPLTTGDYRDYPWPMI